MMTVDGPPSDVSDVSDVSMQSMTRRYTLALLFIAGGMFVAYALLAIQLSDGRGDAAAVNVSGRQRMFSQRIAALARLITREDLSPTRRNEAMVQLRSAVATMDRSQTILTTGFPVRPGLQRRADTEVETFLATARRVLRTRDVSAADELVDIATRGELLRDLDAVVMAYQERSEARLERFKKTEMMLLLGGLSILAIEAWFVFRPLVRSSQRSMQALSSSNRELQEFAYRISHDLRAPLTSSLGIVEVARDAAAEGDVEEVQDSLVHIQRSMQRVVRTVSDITSLMKTKMAATERLNIDVIATVHATVDRFRAGDQGKCLDVSIEPTAAARANPHATTYPKLIDQCVSNLLSNSAKYGGEGLTRAEIRIDRHGTAFTVTVTDDGLGIPEEFHDRIFQMFERFHPREADGTGGTDH